MWDQWPQEWDKGGFHGGAADRGKCYRTKRHFPGRQGGEEHLWQSHQNSPVQQFILKGAK